ncbi:MAG: SRPBCC family protein [Chitinophagales bacterium]
METSKKTTITVETTVHAPVEKVWKLWTSPNHIIQWNNASDDWHTPRAENDLRVGGKFLSRMESRDGSMGFDFGGVYDEVTINKKIAYTIGDGRKVKVNFTPKGGKTEISETFETESENSVDMQRGGWQAILESFKKHAEAAK